MPNDESNKGRQKVEVGSGGLIKESEVVNTDMTVNGKVVKSRFGTSSWLGIPVKVWVGGGGVGLLGIIYAVVKHFWPS